MTEENKKIYDATKIKECFGSGHFTQDTKWSDLPDEVRSMQMSYPIHALLMGFVVDEFMKVVDGSHGVATVTDVGSGTGMFLNYVREKHSLHRIEKYTGYEIVEKFAKKLDKKIRKLQVNGAVEVVDFFESNPVKSDFVIASQCLNTVFSDELYVFIEMAVEKLWNSCKKVLVFDLKDTDAPRKSETRTYYNPVAVYSICRKYTQNVRIVQRTKANFAVVMSRDPLY